MNKIFDHKSFLILDFTKSIPTMLNYHFEQMLADRTVKTCYDRYQPSFHQIAPEQIYVENVPDTITSPYIWSDIQKVAPHKEDLEIGYKQGYDDGYNTMKREFMSIPFRYVTWSFLVGYEYGVLLGSYNRQKEF